ncbi:hypothetical protein [Neptunicella sp.]|uniref:hypothetical protein n=1 Tax=Neptunicella sp. TaxID=2125986 RepID=UPI003F68E55B
MTNDRLQLIASAVLLSMLSAQSVADDKIEKITILGHDTDLIGSAISASEGFVGEDQRGHLNENLRF